MRKSKREVAASMLVSSGIICTQSVVEQLIEATLVYLQPKRNHPLWLFGYTAVIVMIYDIQCQRWRPIYVSSILQRPSRRYVPTATPSHKLSIFPPLTSEHCFA